MIKNNMFKFVKNRYAITSVFVLLLLSRLLSMCFIPLNDSTEARYSEIARIMLETGNWITPMQQYGEPFWAKPPLSMWLTAISMKLFGVNEFAARLPSFLLSIGIVWLVWRLAKTRCGARTARISALVLTSCLFFFLSAGTVMTDPALMFCTTLSIISFWYAVVESKRVWGYIFFISLGLGLLAKGPVAIVLTGLPIFLWVLGHNRWRLLITSLPWLLGPLLMLSVALPWYILAEIRTPGFLNYFIVGEHLHRFLNSGWSGDKYGFAHVAPMGMIWIYAILGMCPWSVIGLGWLVQHVKDVPKLSSDTDNWVSYLCLCTFIPIIFFTFSSNIIYPYVLPSIPPFALLFSSLAVRANINEKTQRDYLVLATIPGILSIIITALFIFKPQLVEHSQKRVIAAYKQHSTNTENRLIYWAPKVDFSARFYSSGKVTSSITSNELCHLEHKSGVTYIVLNSSINIPLPTCLSSHSTEIARIQIMKKTYTLLRI